MTTRAATGRTAIDPSIVFANSDTDLAPAGPSRSKRVRVPQLVVSLLVVAVCALLAVWWQAQASARVPALALANDVEQGVPLVATDLTEVYLNTDVPTRFEDPAFADRFVGVVPRLDLEAGTVVTAAMFRTTSAVPSGQARVGLLLAADQAPTGLRIGSTVQVLTRDSAGETVVLSSEALVDGAVPQRDGSQVSLSLQMSLEDAQEVQTRADRVVVIQIGEADPASWVPPDAGEEP